MRNLLELTKTLCTVAGIDSRLATLIVLSLRVGLPELITHSCEEYEALAIELALNGEKLKVTTEKLHRNRLITPLFDTGLYTKHLEAAYDTLYERHQAGLPPDHIEIRPINVL